MYSNRLSGTVPPAIGGLVMLTSLSMSDNRFSGSLPSTLGALTALQYLYFTDNELTGVVPDAVSALTGLVQLSLASNHFTSTCLRSARLQNPPFRFSDVVRARVLCARARPVRQRLDHDEPSNPGLEWQFTDVGACEHDGAD